MSSKKINHKAVNQVFNLDVCHRKELRYSCVGIPLLYTSTEHSDVTDLASCLHKAMVMDMSLSGLAFDVDRRMYAGDILHVLLEKPGGDTFKEIVTEVRWCQELSSDEYRVGITIDASARVMDTQSNMPMNEFIGKMDVPKEINTRCPACDQQSELCFVSYQPVLGGNGVMPLYDCSLCGTTRSLMGILNPVIK